MKIKLLITAFSLSVLLIAGACSKQADRTYKDSVKTALEQADLKDVSVSEDADKNTITLGGTLHSEEAKQKAGDVAKANAGPRAIANEVSVQPVGQESDAKSIASNIDDGIENNYKAALVEKGLNKEHIKYDAKNGVLTLKGSVKSTTQRKEAEQIAQAVPNVQQVLNQIEIRR